MTSHKWFHWLLVVSLLLGAKLPSLRGQGKPASLTRQESAVLDYLRGDWEKEYRTTGLWLAAKVLKIELRDDSRLRLARYLEANRPSYPRVSQFGNTTLVLTPNEKLLARALLIREIHGKAPANARDIAADLGVSTASLARPLKFLENMGIITGRNGDYHVADRYPRRPSPRIDFYSHYVDVNGRDRFEVA